MGKACELCGKPLDLFPNQREPVMSGEQRMTAWIIGTLSAVAITAMTLGYRSCQGDKIVETQRQAYQADSTKACFEHAEDPAMCLGKVETVRCLPPVKAKSAP